MKNLMFGFAKITALVLVVILNSVNLVSAQITNSKKFESFAGSACQKVQIIFLEKPADNLGFIDLEALEVSKGNDDVYNLTTEAIEIANKQKIETPKTISSDQVISRFKFKIEGKIEYKKYCVDLQESLPTGEKGQLTKSVGGDSGIDLIANQVSMIYRFGVYIIGLVCVLIIVISGFQIIMGGASPEGVSEAKKRIFQAILSLVLLFSAALILKTVNPGFFS